jgi:DNA-binding transcriptional MerR regulator
MSAQQPPAAGDAGPGRVAGRGERGLSIAEAARRSGVPARTIRFYEAEGIVQPPARDANGYRRYGGAGVRRLRLVGRLRRLGLPLPEAGAVAERAFVAECQTYMRDIGALLERQCAAIDQRVAELLALRSELTALAAQARQAEAAAPAGQWVAECGACVVVDDLQPGGPEAPPPAPSPRSPRTGRAGAAGTC